MIKNEQFLSLIKRILITIIIFLGTTFTPLFILRFFGQLGITIFRIARPEMFQLLGVNTAYYCAKLNMINPTGEHAFQEVASF